MLSDRMARRGRSLGPSKVIFGGRHNRALARAAISLSCPRERARPTRPRTKKAPPAPQDAQVSGVSPLPALVGAVNLIPRRAIEASQVVHRPAAGPLRNSATKEG